MATVRVPCWGRGVLTTWSWAVRCWGLEGTADPLRAQAVGARLELVEITRWLMENCRWSVGVSGGLMRGTLCV